MKALIEAYRQRPGVNDIKVRFQPASAANTPFGNVVSGMAQNLKRELDNIGVEGSADAPEVGGEREETSEADALRAQLEAERADRTQEVLSLRTTVDDLERQMRAQKAAYQAREREAQELAELSGAAKPAVKASKSDKSAPDKSADKSADK